MLLRNCLSFLATAIMVFPIYHLGYWRGANPAAPMHKILFFSMCAVTIFGIGYALDDELGKND